MAFDAEEYRKIKSELKEEFDHRYVMQDYCNDKQAQVNKKFANDDKRIEILINKTKVWDKLLWTIASTGIGALIAEILSLIKG